jgi:anti-sigma factor RsiW
MAHCEYADRLTRYHDGELSAERRRELDAHLAGCARCAAELRKLRGLSGLLSEAHAPAAPKGMTERLHRAVAAAGGTGVIRLCRAASLAAAALLVACAVVTLRGPGEPAQAAPAAAWEVAAVTLDPDLAGRGTGEAAALWLMQDLARENGR